MNDPFNAKSVKLAEATRVQLILPGLTAVLGQDFGDDAVPKRHRKTLQALIKLTLKAAPNSKKDVVFIEEAALGLEEDANRITDDLEQDGNDAATGSADDRARPPLPRYRPSSIDGDQQEHGPPCCPTRLGTVFEPRSSSTTSSTSSKRVPIWAQRPATAPVPAATYQAALAPPKVLQPVGVKVFDCNTIFDQATKPLQTTGKKEPAWFASGHRGAAVPHVKNMMRQRTGSFHLGIPILDEVAMAAPGLHDSPMVSPPLPTTTPPRSAAARSRAAVIAAATSAAAAGTPPPPSGPIPWPITSVNFTAISPEGSSYISGSMAGSLAGSMPGAAAGGMAAAATGLPAGVPPLLFPSEEDARPSTPAAWANHASFNARVGWRKSKKEGGGGRGGRGGRGGMARKAASLGGEPARGLSRTSSGSGLPPRSRRASQDAVNLGTTTATTTSARQVGAARQQDMAGQGRDAISDKASAAATRNAAPAITTLRLPEPNPVTAR